VNNTLTSAYDAAADGFDRHRGLPADAANAVRAAVIGFLAPAARPRVLDLGAGSGRIGGPFANAGDDYVGVDLSLGMLRAFAQRVEPETRAGLRLAQADGARLPFRDASFDAVMLIQVFGGMSGWRRVLDEARRVSRPPGVLIIGRLVRPEDGVDARMKGHLASILERSGIEPRRKNARGDARAWLAAAARLDRRAIAAAWTAERTPLAFLERQPTGAQFAAMPQAVREDALRELRDWAAGAFGSLDAVSSERHQFELEFFIFDDKEAH
jgi:ubiquinone/menaquinone biosynthesis C-methylase UbiE